MVEFRHSSDSAPIDIEYDPRRRHRDIPVEVIDRAAIMARKSDSALENRQRLGFHLLAVCTAGQGVHEVDFTPVPMSTGECLRIYPGQVQRFSDEDFDAAMVVWPTESHPPDPAAPAWYPGCNAATAWHLERELFVKVLGVIDEMRYEQERFDGSARKIALMQTLLESLLLRIAIDIPEAVPDAGRLPRAYLDFRERIEERLYERPTVVDLASDLGYSSRTLDRACQQVSNLTAKQVLDERVAFEIRRLLTHTDQPMARIAADFAFHDPSNFSKFVKRHLGSLPGHIRDNSSAEPIA